MIKVLFISIVIYLFFTTNTVKSNSTNQLEVSDLITSDPSIESTTIKEIQDNLVITKLQTKELANVTTSEDESFSIKIYNLITDPVFKVLRAPKVRSVIRNIGTCVVNGAMELFSYYLPPPFMPLIATLAGLAIPFEPVVMLKEKMPVTSYRRAFKTAMNTFLNTFDQYRVEDDYDPYMTRRFNRRFMSDNDNVKKSEDNV